MLYLCLYLFIFVPFQILGLWHTVAEKKKHAKKQESPARVSYRATKYYNSKDMLVLAGSRTVGNFVEFAIVFLPLLWLHALFVDASKSFLISATYVFFRSYYPVVYMKGFLVLTSTVPGYFVLAYMLVGLFKVSFS